MKHFFKLFMVASLILSVTLVKANKADEKDPIEGRWDLTVELKGLSNERVYSTQS